MSMMEVKDKIRIINRYFLIYIINFDFGHDISYN